MMIRSAELSECGTYRYTLERRCRGEVRRTLVFIGLNPSTADAERDDNTIRRIVGFANYWGFDRVLVVNLFAFRATHPSILSAQVDPIGPDNDKHIRDVVAVADDVLCGWGERGGLLDRDAAVRRLLLEAGIDSVSCLGKTKSGQPKHPLYIRANRRRDRWNLRGATTAPKDGKR